MENRGVEVQLLQTAVDTGESWPDAAIAMAGITMLTAIAVVVIWQVFASWRARVSLAREEAYRKLAEQTSSTQQTTVLQLGELTEGMADLRTRVTAIEKLLREVE
jgi:hypothetical protein